MAIELVTSEDKARWLDELCRIDDEIEASAEAIAALVKEQRGEMGKLKQRRLQLRRYISGREREQVQLALEPGNTAGANDGPAKWDCGKNGHVYQDGKCGHCEQEQPK